MLSCIACDGRKGPTLEVIEFSNISTNCYCSRHVKCHIRHSPTIPISQLETEESSGAITTVGLNHPRSTMGMNLRHVAKSSGDDNV